MSRCSPASPTLDPRLLTRSPAGHLYALNCIDIDVDPRGPGRYQVHLTGTGTGTGSGTGTHACPPRQLAHSKPATSRLHLLYPHSTVEQTCKALPATARPGGPTPLKITCQNPPRRKANQSHTKEIDKTGAQVRRAGNYVHTAPRVSSGESPISIATPSWVGGDRPSWSH
jgi:hypothetical protein